MPPRPPRPPVTFCESRFAPDEVERYAEAIRLAAPEIGSHGLTPDEFWDSGLFHSAIERLRGQRAAGAVDKRNWMAAVLDHLKRMDAIRSWEFMGSGDRYDYQVVMPDGRISIIETKGCLDGNNTNIYQRPPNADEFIIWSLCQNPGANPRHNAWSGLHTRLGAETIHSRQRVDGVVIWDMVCGTAGRPCPKLLDDPSRATVIGQVLPDVLRVPPPCIYLFPRTIPDARTNPHPPCWQLREVQLLHALWTTFNGRISDVVEVRIETRMSGVQLQRKTTLVREGEVFQSSQWTDLRRARN